jgi:hypothetical protein
VEHHFGKYCYKVKKGKHCLGTEAALFYILFYDLQELIILFNNELCNPVILTMNYSTYINDRWFLS